MLQSNYKIIITKYINNEATAVEIDALARWLDDDRNYKVFKDYVTIHHSLKGAKVFDAITAYNKAIRVKPLYKTAVFKYALVASVVLCIGLTFMFKNDSAKIKIPTLVKTKIENGTDRAILTLEDGAEIDLDKNQEYNSNTIDSDGKTIIYKSKNSKDSKVAYNYLTIPRGGQFFVQLADGTKVWLNSESKLKYPKAFIENKPREVELVYGEAYFDVSESIHHNGVPFRIETNSQNIEVLGTEFNIKEYRDESSAFATLVEGKVALKKEDTSLILKPNDQATTTMEDNRTTIKRVDVSNVIAWKNGRFIFEEETLENMMNTLSRWYNINPIFTNESQKKLVFSGQLSREANLMEMLTKLEKTSDVVFEIDEKDIIIK